MSNEIKKCLICGKPIKEDADDDQICDACEETRDELSNNKGDEDDE
jgi:predicted nucleic acid-binding Zn ribbon protein